jgi:uncharacterized glyoxalase superfamily protein PhnB
LDNEGMLKHAARFYKTLFGNEQRENIRLDDNFWEESDKVTAEENELLEAELTKEEVKKAIDDSNTAGAPDPDGFSFLFYQRF